MFVGNGEARFYFKRRVWNSPYRVGSVTGRTVEKKLSGMPGKIIGINIRLGIICTVGSALQVVYIHIGARINRAGGVHQSFQVAFRSVIGQTVYAPGDLAAG